MKINCIACGHNFDVDEAYDDYEGPVRCWVCGALLEIKTEEGSIRRMRQVGRTAQTTATVEPAEPVKKAPPSVKRAPPRRTPVAGGKGGSAPTAAPPSSGSGG